MSKVKIVRKNFGSGDLRLKTPGVIIRKHFALQIHKVFILDMTPGVFRVSNISAFRSKFKSRDSFEKLMSCFKTVLGDL